MLEKILGGLTLAEEKVPNGLVIVLGMGVVFIGLIMIVLICKIMSSILNAKKSEPEDVVTNPVVSAPAAPVVIENRQEIIAAVAAVIAEELGTDVEALKIYSFKRI